MKKLANLKGVKALSNKEQKDINGGFTLPSQPTDCGCIQWSTPILPFDIPHLEIVLVDCNSTCPDGSAPISGLGR